MRSLVIPFFIFSSTCFGQINLSELQEKKKSEIDAQVSAEEDKLIVLVKVAGKDALERVLGERWPDNIETTFNVLKNSKGQIIYIAEFPTSESGDWSLALKHYFSDFGKLIAFEKTLAYFNDECSDGAVVETVTELYDGNFKILQTNKKVADSEGKSLLQCDHAYDWTFEKRATAAELANLKGIE